MRYTALIVTLLLGAGCGGGANFWCIDFTGGLSNSVCYRSEDSCNWSRDRYRMSAERPEVSACTRSPQAYCYTARMEDRRFEECFPSSGTCQSTRDQRASANEHATFSSCSLQAVIMQNNVLTPSHKEIALQSSN